MNNSKPNKKPAYPPLRYLSPLHRATRQIQDHLRVKAAAIGLSATEAHLVTYLGSYAPVPVGDLVRVFGLKKSTLTGMLDRLERADMIQRTLNAEDRRSFLLDLTPRGVVASTRMRADLEEFESRLDDALSAADKKAFANLVEAIALVTAPNAKDS